MQNEADNTRTIGYWEVVPAKGTVTDLVSTGASTDFTERILVDSDEGPGASVDFEESWLTLGFFFFSKAA